MPFFASLDTLANDGGKATGEINYLFLQVSPAESN